MTEPSIPILIRILEALGRRILEWFKRPEIATKRAPSNLFEHLKPGTSLAKARDVPGVPIRENERYSSYKYADAFVQVDTVDGRSISAVCVVLPEIKKRATFKVYPLSFTLGKSSMAESVWEGEPIYEYDSSSKHYQFSTNQYFGYDGHYLSYIFGVISAPHISAPSVRWYSEEEGNHGVVVSPPIEIIPNFACISSCDAAEHIFDFWAFH